MLYKNVSNNLLKSVIKDIDTKTGTVTGYFSVFGNIDSDGDIVMPGAFTRTLKNNYHRQKHLNQHRSYEPLSSTRNERLTMKEDDYGLYFESQISQTSYGKDVILLYQDGVLTEHSIGYEVIKSRDSDTKFVASRWDPNKKIAAKELLELKLWEGSTVTFGANELAQVESVKALTKEETFEKMTGILKALRHGKYEQDEIYEMLELHFEQLKQHIIDLESLSSTHLAADARDPQTGVKSDKAKRLKTSRVLAEIELQKQLSA
jgi:hypothetical protein